MSDINSEIDDTPHTKHINIFQVKETILSKNDISDNINNHLTTQEKQLNMDGEIIAKPSLIDKIPTVEKDIKLEEADINQIYFSNQSTPQSFNSYSHLNINSSFYIHCKRCLLILSTENKLQTENALYYLITQSIIQNLIQKQKKYKEHSYTELKCKRCLLLIGCELKDNSKNTSSPNTYFIKKNIISKDNKQMTFSLLGLRNDLLLKIQSQLCCVFDKATAMIDISKQTKDSLEKYAYPKERVDALFIIHKMEGRVFLLGKNGFYNGVIGEFNKKMNFNVFFVLLFKEIENKCTEEYYNDIIDDLINKGGQGELKVFKDSNRIICINDLVFDKEFERKKEMFKDIYDNAYTILSDTIINNDIDDHVDKEDNNQSDNNNKDNEGDEIDVMNKEDNAMINNFIEYFYEGRNKLFANCLML